MRGRALMVRHSGMWVSSQARRSGDHAVVPTPRSAWRWFVSHAHNRRSADTEPFGARPLARTKARSARACVPGRDERVERDEALVIPRACARHAVAVLAECAPLNLQPLRDLRLVDGNRVRLLGRRPFSPTKAARRSTLVIHWFTGE